MTVTGDDAVDLRRLQGDYTQRSNQDEGALQLYEEAIAMFAAGSGAKACV